LEVIGDERTLFPDVAATIEAASRRRHRRPRSTRRSRANRMGSCLGS
jgi:hypothetical protein